jgi:hypothetical protein
MDQNRRDRDDWSGRSARHVATSRRRKRRWAIVLVALAAAFGVLVFSACAGYFLFGVERTSDPAQIHAGLDGMTDMQLPAALGPYQKTIQITGVETVEFRSESGRSYLIVKTGPRFQLRRPDSLRDARDRGSRAGGGRPESPAAEQTITSTVRGQPAEFLYRRFVSSETVQGYFQGKQYAVHLEAQFDLTEFPAGTAAALVGTVR